ncbi:MAG: DUF3073 domain-containing protein [Actinomycetes bacterium]
MGRGRQKAKHTKVARELKYFSPSTDLNALEREIGHPDAENEYIDKWADLYPDDEPSAHPTDSAGHSGTVEDAGSDSGSDAGSSSSD